MDIQRDDGYTSFLEVGFCVTYIYVDNIEKRTRWSVHNVHIWDHFSFMAHNLSRPVY